MLENIRGQSYDSNFMITVNKHAQQTNTCEEARKYGVSKIKTSTDENRNMNIRMPILCENCCMYRLKDKLECQFYVLLLNSMSSRSLKPV
jgi:hypothetical protein